MTVSRTEQLKTVAFVAALLVAGIFCFHLLVMSAETSRNEAAYQSQVRNEQEARRQSILTKCKPTGRQNISTESKLRVGYTTNGDFTLTPGEKIVVKNEYECPDGTRTYL